MGSASTVEVLITRKSSNTPTTYLPIYLSTYLSKGVSTMSKRLAKLAKHDPRRAARLAKWTDQRTTYSIDAIQTITPIY